MPQDTDIENGLEDPGMGKGKLGRSDDPRDGVGLQ